MKKRILCFCLLLTLLSSILPAYVPPAYASEAIENDETYIEYEYFEDGSYLATIIQDEDVTGATPRTSVITRRSKTSTYYSSIGTALWYVTVTGTFTYGDGKSMCIAAFSSGGTYSSNWSITSKSSSASGSTASATFVLLYSTPTFSHTFTTMMTLTCSPTGVFT